MATASDLLKIAKGELGTKESPAGSNKQEWRPVPGYEEIYEVSNFGFIRSVDRVVITKNGKSLPIKGKVLSPFKNKYGYLRVNLCGTGGAKAKYVHQIVASAFIQNEKNYDFVNHKDENKTNNFVSNLEWCNAYHNANWGSRNSRISSSKRNQRGKPISGFNSDGTKVISFVSLSEAGRNGFNKTAIWSAIHNTRQKHGGVKRTYRGLTWRYD